MPGKCYLQDTPENNVYTLGDVFDYTDYKVYYKRLPGKPDFQFLPFDEFVFSLVFGLFTGRHHSID